VNLTLEGD
jgi:hypothetical protein